MKVWHHVFFSILLFCAPMFAGARIIITEVMYDLAGSDNGREWFEIGNMGESTVDITDWKFVEGGVSHRLKAYQGDTMLSAGTYAVVADKPELFLQDNPSFQGMLIDSAFSLRNSGETLVLKNAEGADVDVISYTSENSADGNGMSLVRERDTWIVMTPSPGATVFQATQAVASPVAKESLNAKKKHADTATGNIVASTEVTKDSLMEIPPKKNVLQEAVAQQSTGKTGNKWYIWAVLLLSVIGAGSVLVVFGDKQEETVVADDIQEEARRYTIVETEEE